MFGAIYAYNSIIKASFSLILRAVVCFEPSVTLRHHSIQNQLCGSSSSEQCKGSKTGKLYN